MRTFQQFIEKNTTTYFRTYWLALEQPIRCTTSPWGVRGIHSRLKKTSFFYKNSQFLQLQIHDTYPMHVLIAQNQCARHGYVECLLKQTILFASPK